MASCSQAGGLRVAQVVSVLVLVVCVLVFVLRHGTQIGAVVEPRVADAPDTPSLRQSEVREARTTNDPGH
ncbi:MAG: hypothetical protein OHK0022_08390 [Roseiflexaceae bacterium]